MNQNSDEPAPKAPLPQKKSKTDLIMLKLFGPQKPTRPDRPTTATAEERPWQVLQDANEFNQAHEEVIRGIGEKHI